MHRIALPLVLLLACGGDDSSTAPDAPGVTDVRFGDTALIVVVNPAVNDANDRTVPAPGPTRAGVTITSDDGISATSDAFIGRD